MRTYPDFKDKWDQEKVESLKPEKWMLEALRLNPEYVFWGPNEDYMSDNENGWNSPLFIDSWKDFIFFELDDLNECVNFYFKIAKSHHKKETNCNLSLILWIIHPRKGASRGVEIKNIKKNELKEAIKWLQKAAKRNTERFSKLF